MGIFIHMHRPLETFHGERILEIRYVVIYLFIIIFIIFIIWYFYVTWCVCAIGFLIIFLIRDSICNVRWFGCHNHNFQTNINKQEKRE
jgi:hypothetical protein